MKKTLLKVVALVSALIMVISIVALTGCKKEEKEVFQAPARRDDAVVYEETLGEFNTLYAAAKKATSISERYALMAQAEAKLYEAAILIPTQAQGGNYAMSKAAPYTATSTLWGNDSDRLHTMILAETPLVAADRLAVKAQWKDNPTQSADAFLTWVKSYLEGKGYTLKKSYNRAYSSDPETFDVLATSKAADTEPVVQTYDGLVEYDVMNNLQGAMAKSVPVAVASGKKAVNAAGEEEDTVLYTFEIREGQSWVNFQGQKVADFLASDFVTGFQHMMDAEGGLEYLVEDVIVGATEYITGASEKTMDGVGVTANDEAMTVTYEVYSSKSSYFLTMLSYSVFAPMSKSYYVSKGGSLGADFDNTAEGYVYGTSFENIAYCGPYRISTHTGESTMKFVKNESWWNSADANARNLDEITWLYSDGTEATKTYTDFKAGTIDGTGLNTSTLVLAKNDTVSGDTHAEGQTYFDAYSYVSGTDATAFCFFFNLNRGAFANSNNANDAVSTKTTAQAQLTADAMQNVHFRRALMTSLNREIYMTHMVGPEIAVNGISNMYTPGTFVKLDEAVELTIGGVKKTYGAGTYYGQIVQDQLNADGVQITVFKEVDGSMSSNGFDGWFNADYAKAELQAAISELAAKGIVVDAQHPVTIDYPFVEKYESYANRAAALKKQIEELFEGKVVINTVPVNDYKEWYYAGYYAPAGEFCNYDVYDCSGWGPDYGDPSTYLDTFLPDGAGYMTMMLGIY